MLYCKNVSLFSVVVVNWLVLSGPFKTSNPFPLTCKPTTLAFKNHFSKTKTIFKFSLFCHALLPEPSDVYWHWWQDIVMGDCRGASKRRDQGVPHARHSRFQLVTAFQLSWAPQQTRWNYSESLLVNGKVVGRSCYGLITDPIPILLHCWLRRRRWWLGLSCTT